MDDSHATTVEIFGREYKIKGVADSAYIHDVARYVDEKMKEASEGSSLPSPDRLAILVALNIADELFQQKRRSADGLSEIEEKTESLLSLFDDGGPPED